MSSDRQIKSSGEGSEQPSGAARSRDEDNHDGCIPADRSIFGIAMQFKTHIALGDTWSISLRTFAFVGRKGILVMFDKRAWQVGLQLQLVHMSMMHCMRVAVVSGPLPDAVLSVPLLCTCICRVRPKQADTSASHSLGLSLQVFWCMQRRLVCLIPMAWFLHLLPGASALSTHTFTVREEQLHTRGQNLTGQHPRDWDQVVQWGMTPMDEAPAAIEAMDAAHDLQIPWMAGNTPAGNLLPQMSAGCTRRPCVGLVQQPCPALEIFGTLAHCRGQQGSHDASAKAIACTPGSKTMQDHLACIRHLVMILLRQHAQPCPCGHVCKIW